MKGNLEGNLEYQCKYTDLYTYMQTSQTVHRTQKAASLASLLASWQSVTQGGSTEPFKHPLATSLLPNIPTFSTFDWISALLREQQHLLLQPHQVSAGVSLKCCRVGHCECCWTHPHGYSLELVMVLLYSDEQQLCSRVLVFSNSAEILSCFMEGK